MKKYLIVIGNDPYLSAKVQKMLFEAGFSWAGGKNVQYTETNVLVAYEDGNITYAGRSIADYTKADDGDRYVVYSGAELDITTVFGFMSKPWPTIPVKEMTMEDLNKLSVEKFGYEIKIKK